ncbi:hypothetical protein BKA70DRAFT_1231911 [Coprinopsis sp. MPI-PUGE-AT-0042]|nr:hypothetical protein BKA70DRAFT_1231911 [Coprinopsis sp. MPI-PUGE-AT-0042]
MSYSRPLPPPPSYRSVARPNNRAPRLSVASFKPSLVEMLATTPAKAYLGQPGRVRVSINQSLPSRQLPEPEAVQTFQNFGSGHRSGCDQAVIRRASLAVTVKRDSIAATIAELQDVVSISSAMPAHMSVENGRQATSHRLKRQLESAVHTIAEAVSSAWSRGPEHLESPPALAFSPIRDSLVPSETSTLFDNSDSAGSQLDLHQMTGNVGYLSEDNSVVGLTAETLIDLVELAQETMRRRFFDHIISHSEFDRTCSVCNELIHQGYFFERIVVTL